MSRTKVETRKLPVTNRPSAINVPRPDARQQLFAKITAEEVEALARSQASEQGFDIDAEKNGLLRAMLHVLSSKDLMVEVARRSRERLERMPHWKPQGSAGHVLSPTAAAGS